MSADRLGVLLLSAVRHQAGYVPYFAAHPRLCIVALADEPSIPDWMHASNQHLADTLGVPYVRDVDTALARRDVAMASVCAEPTRHARLATRAADAGKHVLVDKPMALSVDEAEGVAAAARQSGKKLTFVHRLFSPSVQRLRELIDSGRVGLPWAVHVSWLSAGGLGGGTVERDELVADPRLSGGGELANFLGYPVGYARYLTGLEVTSVYASAATHVHEPHQRYGVEDFGVVSLTLEHDVMATITAGRLPERAASGPGVYTIRVHGSHASVMVDEYRPRVQVFPSGAERYGGDSAGEQALRDLLADFVAAIDEDRDPLCGPEDGRALAAVLQAAYTSVSRGDVVDVEQPG